MQRKETAELRLSVAWYKPEQWNRLLEISADAAELEATFAEWLIHAEKTLKALGRRGVFPEKVDLDTEALLAWCNERNLKINSESRSQYASWLLKEQDKGNKRKRKRR